MARIIVKDGVSERTVELADAITIAGRSSENKIHIEDKQASRKHCQFERTDFGYKLVDLESRNGTRVNDKVVNQALLRPGDRVEIGKHVMVFEDPAFKEPPAEVAARFAPAPSPAAPAPPPPSPPSPPSPSPAAAPSPAPAAPEPAEPRLRRRTGHTTSIERAARLEVAREKSMLTKFGIGVGVFMFIIVVLILIPPGGGGSDSKEARKSRDDFAKGKQYYDAKQFDAALLVLEPIPPAHAEPYQGAQALIREIRKTQGKTFSPPTEEERRMFDELYQFCEKNRTVVSAMDTILQRCTAFKQKFPRSQWNQNVDDYIKMASENRRSKGTTEVAETERLAQEDARRHEYASAIRRLNDFLKKPGDDIDLRKRIVDLHQQTLEKAKAWYTAEAAKADGHKGAGRRDEAARIYEALVIAMGDGTVDELADYCTLARTTLKGLK